MVDHGVTRKHVTNNGAGGGLGAVAGILYC